MADVLLALDAIPHEHIPAAIARLAARALMPPPAPASVPSPPAADDLLTADEVAKRLKVRRRWVYRHARQLGAHRVGERKLRFSRRQVDRYLAGAAA